ncbi:MAG: hypothetical protein ACREEM_26780 [Blastocatellia bacterium]
MLTESLLIALAGGMLGALLAAWGIDLLVAFSAGNLPPTARIGMDATVLAFTVGISVLTGMLFGLAPALQTLKVNLNETLKADGRGGAESFERNRTRNLLVVLETAIAVVLLVGAGLLIRSLVRLQNVHPGFEAENVLTLRIDLSEKKYDRPEKSAAFFSQLETRVSALPGVEAVGMTTELPLSGQPNDTGFTVAGRPPARPNEAYGEYFWTMPLSQLLQAARTNPPLNLRFENDAYARNSNFNYPLITRPGATDFIGGATVNTQGIVPLSPFAQSIWRGTGETGKTGAPGRGTSPSSANCRLRRPCA